ncbi:MAG: hypothetical protein N3A61_08755, partial [Ignavibacteria bacterium]|nr:hypothetical protein [Ignavibacteria bacterium]
GLTLFPFYIRELQAFTLYLKNYLGIVSPIIVLMLFFILKHREKLRVEIFGFYFFSLAILLVLRQLMRWYLYLPSIGIILIFATLLSKVKNQFVFYSVNTLVILIFIVTLLGKQNNWLIVSDFVEKETNVIVSQISYQKPNEVLFLNLPAKWNDIPIFQLGFEHHLKHYLKYNPEIKVFSKIYLNSLNEDIDLKVNGESFTLKLTEPSYFILTAEEFLSQKRVPKISDTLTYIDSKYIIKNIDRVNRPKEIEVIIQHINATTTIFLFTKGNFQKIKL